MITYKIHLFRTGTTQIGDKRIYTGQSDPELSPAGVEHLEAMKEAFVYPPVSMVYSSPLKRCLQTADILYPDNQVLFLDDLKDMSLGEFQGKTFEELEHDPDFVNWVQDSASNSPPGGEGTTTFTRRIVAAINRIFFEMMEQKLSDVAVITHGGVIMTLLFTIGLPKMPMNEWSVDNGVGYTLLMTPQMWMNDYSCEVYSHAPYLREDRE